MEQPSREGRGGMGGFGGMGGGMGGVAAVATAAVVAVDVAAAASAPDRTTETTQELGGDSTRQGRSDESVKSGQASAIGREGSRWQLSSDQPRAMFLLSFLVTIAWRDRFR